MSVVNKMLQDIDRRRAAAGHASAAAPVAHAPLPQPSRRRAGRLAMWLAIAALLAALCWQNRDMFRQEPARIVSAPPPIVVPPPALAAAIPPPTMASAATPEPAVAAASPAAVAPVIVATTPASASPVVPAPPVETAPKKKESRQARQSAADLLRLSTDLSALTLAPSPTASPASQVRPSDSSKSSIAIRQIAGEETVRAARVLWNDGAHAAAIETLRQALAAAEEHRDAAATQPLARELARMLVSENQPQAALDLLKRLESRFIDDADAWSLRANAQQRLGMHVEASESYLGALRLRGGEPRWMLGAAISLAAVGRLDEARLWTERAAERGPIPPSIATYLRQLGVAVP